MAAERSNGTNTVDRRSRKSVHRNDERGGTSANRLVEDPSISSKSVRAIKTADEVNESLGDSRQKQYKTHE